MVHQAQDPLIGQVLDGRYAITRVLGTGGMGVVYEAHQQRLNRKVAIKTIHAHLASKGVVVERFRREAMAAASAGSQHIVDVYDLGVMPTGAPYMVMELIDGTDLRTLVETSGRLASSRAAHIVRQACDALEAAHEVGIIHRDVKPENIMITRRRNDPAFVKVVDFGISKLRDSSLTGSHELLGTPYAMAPEQLRGAGHVDARCDVYGLGVCLYWALSGDVPYDADALPLLIAQISTGRATPLKSRVRDLPPAAYDLVATAMASDPDQRFRSMSAFSAALRSLENAAPSAALAPTQAPVPTPVRKPPPPAPPRPIPKPPSPALVEPKQHAIVEPKHTAEPVRHAVHARDTTQSSKDRLPTTFGSKLFRLLLAFALLGGVAAGAFYGLEMWQRRATDPADAGVALADAGVEPDTGLIVAQAIDAPDTNLHAPSDVDASAATPRTTITVTGLQGAEVHAGERSCVTPCSLLLPEGDRRVRILYAENWLQEQLDVGEHLTLPLGAARVEIEGEASVSVGPHLCRGRCTVPLPVGRHAASATWDGGAANSTFNVREGEIADVGFLQMRNVIGSAMRRATGRVRFGLRSSSVEIRVAGQTCHTPCTLDLPAGDHTVVTTRDGQTNRHSLTVRAGQTLNVGYQPPIQLMRQQPMDAASGTLVITGRARRIQVSGRSCAPPCRLQLRPGTHRALITRNNGQTTSRQFTIRSGETTRVSLGPSAASMATVEDVLTKIFSTPMMSSGPN